MPRKCVNHPDSFCYVCGDLTFKDQRQVWLHWLKNIMNYTLAVKWGIKIRTGPLIYAVWPVWNVWQIGLRVLGTWTLLHPWCGVNHKIIHRTVIFCITQIKGISSKPKHTVKYPNLPSAMRSVPHREDLPITHLPTHLTLEDESEHKAATEVPNEEQNDATYETSTSSCEHHLVLKAN